MIDAADVVVQGHVASTFGALGTGPDLAATAEDIALHLCGRHRDGLHG